jgi:hypothetical protein
LTRAAVPKAIHDLMIQEERRRGGGGEEEEREGVDS